MPTSDLLIRDATPADDPAIGDVLVDAFVTAYGKRHPEIRVSDARKADLRDVAKKRAHGRVWVAQLGNRIVGTVTAYPPNASVSHAWVPNSVELRYLATVSELHGRGLSSALLDAAEAWARELGAASLLLNVRRGVVGVARLYEKRGYVRDPRGDRTEPPDVLLDGYIRVL